MEFAAPPLRLLGPGQIISPHDGNIALRSRKQFALLTYLAVEHATAHSRNALMALLWPEEPLATAQNNLRVTLSRLRELSGQIGQNPVAPAELLLADRHAVQIHPAWINHVDVNCFHQLLEDTRQHPHTSRGRCERCQAPLLDAIRLYQGEFVAGLELDDCPAFEEWITLQRERLRMLALDAYADLAEYAETSQEFVAATGYAQRQIELDALHEPAYRQLMRIHARKGDRSTALAVYEQCRVILNTELGIDPEPDTQSLRARIAAGSMAATENSSNAHSGPSESFSIRHAALPRPLTPFIGRDDELEQLHAHLTDPSYRLISIIGPGGAGKSRLSLQAAAQHANTFRDGVCFIALAQVPSAESIPAAIAEALGISFVTGTKSQIAQLVDAIGDKSMLLVLDNFEHLMPGAGILVTLLQQAPRVMLLVTSRERLNVQAEDTFELQGLSTPESAADATAAQYAAVRLFVDRAHRINKQFKLTADELGHVIKICQLVEGSPLAIELAATWADHMSCEEIASELTAGLDKLETTLRDVDPQHRSLSTVFDTSWRLLTDPEQRTLAALSVFRGGFNRSAANAVAAASPGVLNSLRNKSLLRAAGARRFDMHALVQQLSAETLTAQARAEARRAHCDHFMSLLADHAITLDTRAARSSVDTIQPDWENVLVAWHEAAEQGRLALLQNALDGFVRFCNLRGLFKDAQLALERTLAQPALTSSGRDAHDEAVRQTLRCGLLTAIAYFAERRALPDAVARSEVALAYATQIGNIPQVISNHIIQASAAAFQGRYPQCQALAERGLHMAQMHGFELLAAQCLDLLGIVALQTNKYERADGFFRQVLDIHDKTGRIEQCGRAAVGNVGSVATEEGRYDVALAYGQQYVQSCEEMDDRHNLAKATHYMAYLWVRLGFYDKAIATDLRSETLADSMGDREAQSMSLHCMAWAQRHLGQLDDAFKSAKRALALARTIQAPHALGFALSNLAETQMLLVEQHPDPLGAPMANSANWEEIAAHFEEASTTFRTMNKATMALEAQIGLAELDRRRGQLQSALARIVTIMPKLPTITSEGWDEPIRAYVVCVRILRAVNDPRADDILDRGLALLNGLAHKIIDPDLRRNFLTAIPAHRDLRALVPSLHAA